jgi:tetratricopeptide (TPR) repeat protein
MLQHPDTLHLQAALGWLELGNHLEANQELEKITPSLRAHPDVLVVRWQIYAKAEKWEGAFEIARTLVEIVPEFPNAWILKAEAVRRIPGGEGVKGAWAALLPAADKFPKESAILYNLACYSCQMGRIADAWAWLEMAFKVGDHKQLKLKALDDLDLEQLWAEIAEV